MKLHTPTYIIIAVGIIIGALIISAHFDEPGSISIKELWFPAFCFIAAAIAEIALHIIDKNATKP